MPMTFETAIKLSKTAIASTNASESNIKSAGHYMDIAETNFNILTKKYKALEAEHYELKKRIASLCGYHRS